MTIALQRYKDLVDQLRGLSPSSAESEVHCIDEQLKEAWEVLGESERLEADAYWRATTSTQMTRPKELS